MSATQGILMTEATNVLTLVAGLILSIACAALIEELILGGLFRLFFARRPESSQPKHPKPGHNH
jgi:hypothetical protein